jgi:hypothetical protein
MSSKIIFALQELPQKQMANPWRGCAKCPHVIGPGVSDSPGVPVYSAIVIVDRVAHTIVWHTNELLLAENIAVMLPRDLDDFMVVESVSEFVIKSMRLYIANNGVVELRTDVDPDE